MASVKILDNAKVMCQLLVGELFPKEATIFNDAWSVLLPLFEKWQSSRPRSRRFSAADFSVAGGLGFGDARDWGLPITVMTAVATMLEVWESRGGLSESGVRTSVSKYAHYFGAPSSLKDLLVEKVPAFCLQIYRELAGMDGEAEGAERKQKIEESIPERKSAKNYTVQTHKDKEPTFLTLEEVKGYKKRYKLENYFVWIDESQSEVFVDGKKFPIGSRPRKVLQYLIQLRGQRIAHEQLVKNCGDRVRYMYIEREKTARRWVNDLRRTSKGRLRHLIKTKDGGFVYEGPSSYCIIKQLF